MGTAVCGGGVDGGKAGGAMLGEQWRKIMCLDNNGKLVDDSYCDAAERAKYSESKIGCNSNPCTNYNWMTTKWSSCIVDPITGKGKRLRTTHCHAPDGGNAAVDDCITHVPFDKPHLKEECSVDKCPSNLAPTIPEELSSSNSLSPYMSGFIIMAALMSM